MRGNRKTPKKRCQSTKITAATTTYWMICLTLTTIRGRGSRKRIRIDSGDAYKIFDKQDDTSVDQDSADGVEKGRKKKKKEKKQSSDEEENNSKELSDIEYTEHTAES